MIDQTKYFNIILLFSCLLLSISLMAQNNVTGTVTDDSGIPLPGVTVLEKGTSNGTVTDFDGLYEISVSSNPTLVFSFISFKTKEVQVSERNIIDVSLKESNTQLDEVVVVGFGTTTKKNLTGAVSTLKVDDVVSQPTSDPTQLLYGRVSGLQLEQNSGTPGSSSSITLRGPNIGNSAPLIVVDGIIVDSFNQVSPSDIESFSILKDAASASIYGAQGANGVILITTKSGKEGEIKVKINSSVGIIKPTDLPELLSGADYANAINERDLNQGGNGNIYSQEIIEKIQNGTADPNYFGGTNWVEELFEEGLYTEQYMSLSGGSENANYLLSMRYNNQQGTLIGDKSSLNTYNVRAKMDYSVNKWLDIGINMVGDYRKINSPGSNIAGNGGVYRNAMQMSPLRPIYYNNGDFNAGESYDGNNIGLPFRGNPVFDTQDGEDQVDNYRVNTKLYAKLRLADGLTFEPAFVHKYFARFSSKFLPTYELYKSPDRKTVSQSRTQNLLSKNAGVTNEYQIDNILRYNKKINENHYLGGLLGHQLIQEDINQNIFGIKVQDLATNDLRGLINGVQSTLELNGGLAPRKRKIQSFFGRLEYRYKDRYLFEANYRIDGGSQFSPENRYGYFPSFSAGWRISEEEFMDDLEFIDQLKLRGSWGLLGSLNNLSLFPYQQTFVTTQDYFFGGELVDGVAINSLANSELKWETTETYDIGLDLNLFRKLSLTADWYLRDTRDIILRDTSIPIIAGDLAAPFVNAGRVRNEGWELSLDYSDFVGDNFKYNFGFIVTKNRNELLSLIGDEKEVIQFNVIRRVGEPLNAYYGLKFEGIYQTQEEIDEGPVPVDPSAVPGFKRYADISGPDGVPDGKVDTNYDREIIGNSFPDYVYGFTAGAEYKGFDLFLTLNGVAGVDRLRPQNGNNPVQGNLLTSWLDRWSPSNPSDEFPLAGSDALFSSWNVVNGSYLRLKVAELGYSIPDKFAKNIQMDRVRVYLSGTNLLTFTDFTDGFDPEKSARNFRNENYPINQTFVVGMILAF